jgi:hypothetical protein
MPGYWRECNCPCHKDQHVLHIIMCCITCDYCHKRISPAGAMKNHLTDAHPDVTVEQEEKRRIL